MFNFKFTFFLDINIQGADGAQPIHFAARYFKAQKHIATTDHPVKEVLPLVDAEESFGKISSENLSSVFSWTFLVFHVADSL